MDAYVVGESQGEWMGNYVVSNNLSNDDASMYLCLTMETVSSCLPRSEGAYDKFRKVAPDFSEDKIIKADYDGTSELAYDVVAATVTANPQITKWVITAPNVITSYSIHYTKLYDWIFEVPMRGSLLLLYALVLLFICANLTLGITFSSIAHNLVVVV